MSKMSIAEASEFFGISKEAIHNRIRRGSLTSVVEDNIKYVVVDTEQPQTLRAPVKKTIQNVSTDRYYALLEEQNAKLQEKIEKLEDETRSLRDQKEQMLIAERHKIEQIYKDKDEQLKNILNSFKAQFLVAPSSLEASQEEIIEEEEELIAEAETEIEPLSQDLTPQRTIISLKRFLKEQGISEKKREKIKTRFKKRAKKDDRVIRIGKKYYLDLDKYDYEDLVK